MDTTSAFMTTEQAAEFLNVPTRNLEFFRRQGRGPVYHKIGKRVVYRLADLEAWLTGTCRVTPYEGEGR